MARILGLLAVILGAGVALVGGGLAVAGLFAPGGPRPGPVAVAAVAAAVGVGLVVIGVRVLRRNRPPKPVGTGGRVNGYRVNQPERWSVGGRPFEVHYLAAIAGKQGRPASLTVRVPVESAAAVEFRRKTGFDRFAESVGLVPAAATDDPDYDRAVYARSAQDDYAARVAESAPARAAVQGLLEAGFPAVRLTGHHAEAGWVGVDPAKHHTDGLQDLAGERVLALAAALPVVDPADLPAPSRRPYVLWTLLGLAAVTVVGVFVYPPVRTSQLLALAAVAFAGAYPLFTLVAGVGVRGSSVGHDRWKALALGGFVLVALASVGGTALFNGAADGGPAEAQTLPVVDKNTSRNKNRTNYHVTVPDWRRPGETVRYGVGQGVYDAVRVGRSTVTVRTRPGRLGVEWELGHAVQP